MSRSFYTGLALLVSIVAPVSAQAIAGPTPTAPEIHTSGSGSRAVTPDLVTLTVEFSVRRRTPSEAGRANAERALAIRRALIALGIPGDSVVTQGYRSQLTTDGYQRDTGFVATNTVIARIRDLRLIGPAIDTALAEGATRVADVRFSSSDTEEPYRAALRDATDEARRRAATMASAAGGRLGRLIELTTRSRSYYEGSPFSVDGIVVTASEATPIQARTLQVTATVFGRWEFVPN